MHALFCQATELPYEKCIFLICKTSFWKKCLFRCEVWHANDKNVRIALHWVTSKRLRFWHFYSSQKMIFLLHRILVNYFTGNPRYMLSKFYIRFCLASKNATFFWTAYSYLQLFLMMSFFLEASNNKVWLYLKYFTFCCQYCNTADADHLNVNSKKTNFISYNLF